MRRIITNAYNFHYFYLNWKKMNINRYATPPARPPYSDRDSLGGNKSAAAVHASAPERPMRPTDNGKLDPAARDAIKKKLFADDSPHNGVNSDADSDVDPGPSAACDDYFRKIPSGYKKCVNGYMVEPMIYQPTPAGLELLVADFVEKTGHDLRLEDQRNDITSSSSTADRFKASAAKIDAINVSESKPVGVILSNGQNHAIPLLLTMINEKKYMFIFDSTSGTSTVGYAKVGNEFPDMEVMLNNGSRQVDGQSCITDAFEVLKKAFSVENLSQKILGKKLLPREGARFAQSMLKHIEAPKVPNFSLFKMPEELCFTAQRTNFVTVTSDATMNALVVGENGKMITLENSMRAYKTVVAVNNGPQKYLGINCYLHIASQRHKEIIEERLQRLQSEKAGKSSKSELEKVGEASNSQ